MDRHAKDSPPKKREPLPRSYLIKNSISRTSSPPPPMEFGPSSALLQVNSKKKSPKTHSKQKQTK